MSDDNDRDEREELEVHDEKQPQTRQVVTQKKSSPADRSDEYYGYMGAGAEND